MLNWIVSSTSVVANQRRFGSAQMLIFYFFPARFLPSPPLALRDILACVFTYMLVDLLGLDNFSIFPYRYVLGRNHPYLCQKPWCDRQGEHIFNIGNLVVGESVIFFFSNVHDSRESIGPCSVGETLFTLPFSFSHSQTDSTTLWP